MAEQESSTQSPIRTRVEAGVGYLSLDHPPANVLDIPVMEKAVAALRALEQDPAVKVIAFEAAGKLFSGGVEVADHTPEKMDRMLGIFNELCVGLYRSPKPTVALVQGHALGGGMELAAFCDLVLASDRAKFGQPEIKVGVYPVLGVAMYAQMFGTKMANEISLSGETYTAEQAKAFGLVNKVFPADSFAADAAAYLAGLTGNSGVVMSVTKKAMLVSAGKAPDDALAAAEEVYVKELMVTKDANEGLAAFIEKRAPIWTES